MRNGFIEKKRIDDKHTEDQHYVPRFLLRNFSFNKKQVLVWDRKTQKIFTTSTEAICFAKDLYDQKWENGAEDEKYILGNQIERGFADEEHKASILIHDLVQKARTYQRKIVLCNGEKKLLYDFITDLYMRNPVIMRTILEFYSGVEDEPDLCNLQRTLKLIFDLWGWGDPESMVKYSKINMLFNRDISGGPYDTERKRLDSFSYVFWVSPDDEFVTSCFPLQILSDKDAQWIRVIVPLSAGFAVVLFKDLPVGLEEGLLLTPSRQDIQMWMQYFAGQYPVDMARHFVGKKASTLEMLKSKSPQINFSSKSGRFNGILQR